MKLNIEMKWNYLDKYIFIIIKFFLNIFNILKYFFNWYFVFSFVNKTKRSVIN